MRGLYDGKSVILDLIQDPVTAQCLQQGHLDMCTLWILAFARMTGGKSVILDLIQDPAMAPWLQQGRLDMCTHWILAFARMTEGKGVILGVTASRETVKTIKPTHVGNN